MTIELFKRLNEGDRDSASEQNRLRATVEGLTNFSGPRLTHSEAGTAYSPPDVEHFTVKLTAVTNVAGKFAYSWTEQQDLIDGSFIDKPGGLSGTSTYLPLFERNNSGTVAVNTIVEAAQGTGLFFLFDAPATAVDGSGKTPWPYYKQPTTMLTASADAQGVQFTKTDSPGGANDAYLTNFHAGAMIAQSASGSNGVNPAPDLFAYPYIFNRDVTITALAAFVGAAVTTTGSNGILLGIYDSIAVADYFYPNALLASTRVTSGSLFGGGPAAQWSGSVSQALTKNTVYWFVLFTVISSGNPLIAGIVPTLLHGAPFGAMVITNHATNAFAAFYLGGSAIQYHPVTPYTTTLPDPFPKLSGSDKCYLLPGPLQAQGALPIPFYTFTP